VSGRRTVAAAAKGSTVVTREAASRRGSGCRRGRGNPRDGSPARRGDGKGLMRVQRAREARGEVAGEQRLAQNVVRAELARLELRRRADGEVRDKRNHRGEPRDRSHTYSFGRPAMA